MNRHATRLSWFEPRDYRRWAGREHRVSSTLRESRLKLLLGPLGLGLFAYTISVAGRGQATMPLPQTILFGSVGGVALFLIVELTHRLLPSQVVVTPKALSLVCGAIQSSVRAGEVHDFNLEPVAVASANVHELTIRTVDGRTIKSGVPQSVDVHDLARMMEDLLIRGPD